MAGVARAGPPGAPRARGFLDRLFGTPPPPAFPPDGLPRTPGLDEPESLYLLYALFVGLAVAVALEWIIQAEPVPPGGDPGQWVAASFPWIHATYPSQVIFLGYPPLVFPLLGFLVVLGGSPIAGAQLYVALGAVVLGLATYAFARSAVRRPVLALLVEGFVLLNAPFMRLFFFGSYPTILALTFMELGMAAFLRWIGSYRPRYLFLAWVLLTATLLTHSLVGLLALGALVFVCLVLFFQRALPREILFSRAGAGGFAVFVLGVGGYYLGTRLAGILHPNYLQVNALGRSKTNLSQLLYPFHLGSLPGVFGHHAYFSGAEAFGAAIILGVVLFFAIAFLAARRRLPTAALVQGALVLVVVAIGIVGWVLSIVTDYRRFAYLLYIPITMAVAYVLDYLLGSFLKESSPGPETTAPRPETAPPTRWRRPARRIDAVGLVLGVGGLGALLFVGLETAFPTYQEYEVEYTGPPHSVSYLQAVGAINHNGRTGSVLTDNTASARWTRALTNRNCYSNSEPTDFVFYGSQILDDELANFAFNNLYGVTDGTTSATISSLNASGFQAAPQYNAYREGIALSVFGVEPGSLEVKLVGGKTNLHAYSATAGTPPVFRFLRPGEPAFSLVYTNASFNVTEIVEPHPPANGFSINFTVTDTATANLSEFSGFVQSLNGVNNLHRAGALSFLYPVTGLSPGGQFVTNLTVEGAPTTTAATVPPGAALPGFSFHEVAPNATRGVRTLSVELNASTPEANNLIPGLPPVLSGPTILKQWSAAYVLLDHNGTGYLPRFTAQYGAAPLGSFSGWTVLELPESFPADPYGPP